MRTLKVISLYEPWASFISLGWKTIETRTHNRFKGLVGQTIGIHAGQHWDKDWYKLAGPYMTDEQVQKVVSWSMFRTRPLASKIICTAFIYDSQQLGNVDSKHALINCDFEKGKYGLFLNDIRIIKPILVKGQQGIFKYETDKIELL